MRKLAKEEFLCGKDAEKTINKYKNTKYHTKFYNNVQRKKSKKNGRAAVLFKRKNIRRQK